MTRLDAIRKRPPGYYFQKLDSYNLLIHIGKVQLFQLNLFRDDSKLRKSILPLIIVAASLWAMQGIDSSVEQIEYFVLHIPAYLMGQLTWSQLIFYYTDAYGKYVHYSAFVIYMLFFVGISKYLHDQLEVVNSENVISSICFVALSVGLFEYFWNISYCFLQSQPWVLSFQMPQFRILWQNIAMIAVGLIFLLGMDWKQYRLNLNKWTGLCFLAFAGCVALWYSYGYLFPIQQITVPIVGGPDWTSALAFPQTVYTVKTDVTNNIMAGTQFWVQNDPLHLVNTATKVFLTLGLYSLLSIKRRMLGPTH